VEVIRYSSRSARIPQGKGNQAGLPKIVMKSKRLAAPGVVRMHSARRNTAACSLNSQTARWTWSRRNKISSCTQSPTRTISGLANYLGPAEPPPPQTWTTILGIPGKSGATSAVTSGGIRMDQEVFWSAVTWCIDPELGLHASIWRANVGRRQRTFLAECQWSGTK